MLHPARNHETCEVCLHVGHAAATHVEGRDVWFCGDCDPIHNKEYQRGTRVVVAHPGRDPLVVELQPDAIWRAVSQRRAGLTLTTTNAANFTIHHVDGEEDERPASTPRDGERCVDGVFLRGSFVVASKDAGSLTDEDVAAVVQACRR